MKTHSQENYHICPYADCGKRFAHEYKLKNHITSHHEKVTTSVYCIALALVYLLFILIYFFFRSVLF